MENDVKHRQVLLNSAIGVGKLLLLNCNLAIQGNMPVKGIDFAPQ